MEVFQFKANSSYVPNLVQPFMELNPTGKQKGTLFFLQTIARLSCDGITVAISPTSQLYCLRLDNNQ